MCRCFWFETLKEIHLFSVSMRVICIWMRGTSDKYIFTCMSKACVTCYKRLCCICRLLSHFLVISSDVPAVKCWVIGDYDYNCYKIACSGVFLDKYIKLHKTCFLVCIFRIIFVLLYVNKWHWLTHTLNIPYIFSVLLHCLYFTIIVFFICNNIANIFPYCRLIDCIR